MASVCGWKSPVPGKPRFPDPEGMPPRVPVTTHSCLHRTPVAYFCCDSFCRAKAGPACERGHGLSPDRGKELAGAWPTLPGVPHRASPLLPHPRRYICLIPERASSKGGQVGHVGSCLGLQPLQVVGAWALGPDHYGQAKVWGLWHRHPHPALGPTKAQARGGPGVVGPGRESQLRTVLAEALHGVCILKAVVAAWECHSSQVLEGSGPRRAHICRI